MIHNSSATDVLSGASPVPCRVFPGFIVTLRQLCEAANDEVPSWPLAETDCFESICKAKRPHEIFGDVGHARRVDRDLDLVADGGVGVDDLGRPGAAEGLAAEAEGRFWRGGSQRPRAGGADRAIVEFADLCG